MNYAKINSITLPVQFQYNFTYRDKIAQIDTILASRYIAYDFNVTDVKINFILEDTTEYYYNLLKDLFTSRQVFLFTDYDNNIWNVIIKRFESKEVRGFYDISGEFAVVED